MKSIAAFVAAAFAASAFAQDKPAAAPPPSWQQGKPAALAESTLHPFAPHLTGRPAKDLPTNTLKVPAGFKVEVWVDGIPEARSLAMGDKGTLFVSNRNAKNVYAVVSKDGKREVKTVLSGLDAPNGIVFSKGTLYVAERGKITRYDGIEANLDSPQGKVMVDNLDPSRAPGHFWKYLAMGPDGKLYFNIGAPGNIVLPNYTQATIMRVDPDKGILETVAVGVRNSVGMDFNPKTKELWFTNHARDWLGDDSPNDTLHRVAGKSVPHFGYPFCHQGDTLDPEYGKNRSCAEFAKPSALLGTHIAPLGMKFYNGKMFPAEYQNNIFIAMHGSWNRTVKQGYNVMRVKVDENGKAGKPTPFLTGFMTDEKADPPMWGRPVDLLVMKDGSMLVSDDYNGIIYRVSYGK
jgi:glucose/arabinose dehydrogenase